MFLRCDRVIRKISLYEIRWQDFLFGDSRMVSCCREISKVYEESVRGTLAQVLAHFKETTPKGEFVIVLAGKEKEKKRKDINEDQHSSKYNENR